MSESPGGPSSQPASIAEKRCLSAVLEWGLALGVFDPERVLGCVPPREIMRALAHRPDVRAAVLDAAQLPARPGESAAALGDRVLCAIERGDADAGAVVEALPLDDCAWLIPHLVPLASVWELLSSANDLDGAEGRAFLGFALERFMDIGLVDTASLVEAASLSDIVGALTHVELVALTRCLLRTDPGFDVNRAVLECVIPARIAEVTPIERLWEGLLLPRLEAARHAAAPPPTLTFQFAELSYDEEESITVAKRSSRPGELAPDSTPSGDFSEREGIVAALASVGRLPPHHSNLPLAILRGMEQLYWAMLAAETVDQRIDAFYATFPNDADLRVALVAMQPIFFPEEEIEALAETALLIEAIERADRDITAREIDSGISARLASDAPTSAPPGSGKSPVGRVPLRSVVVSRGDKLGGRGGQAGSG